MSEHSGDRDIDQETQGQDVEMETISVDGSIMGEGDLADDGRCIGCVQPFTTESSPMTGECGHTQCGACWEGGSNACATCHKVSDIRPAYAMAEARDFMSPPPLDAHPSTRPGDAGASDNHSAKMAVSGQQTMAAAPAPVSATRTLSLAAPVMASTTPTQSVAASIGSSSMNGDVDIKVKCMNGHQSNLRLNPDRTTVGQLKRMIHTDSGISYERQTLLHKGKAMSDDSKPLKNYKVSQDATIQMGTKNTGG